MTAIQSHVQSVVSTLEKAPAIVLTAREALRFYGAMDVRQIDSQLALAGKNRWSLQDIIVAIETEAALPAHVRCIREATGYDNENKLASFKTYIHC